MRYISTEKLRERIPLREEKKIPAHENEEPSENLGDHSLAQKRYYGGGGKGGAGRGGVEEGGGARRSRDGKRAV